MVINAVLINIWKSEHKLEFCTRHPKTSTQPAFMVTAFCAGGVWSLERNGECQSWVMIESKLLHIATWWLLLWNFQICSRKRMDSSEDRTISNPWFISNVKRCLFNTALVKVFITSILLYTVYYIYTVFCVRLGLKNYVIMVYYLIYIHTKTVAFSFICWLKSLCVEDKKCLNKSVKVYSEIIQ